MRHAALFAALLATSQVQAGAAYFKSHQNFNRDDSRVPGLMQVIEDAVKANRPARRATAYGSIFDDWFVVWLGREKSCERVIDSNSWKPGVRPDWWALSCTQGPPLC